MGPAFRYDKMNNIFNVCVEISNRLISRWSNFSINSEIDLHSELTKLSLDIVGKAGIYQ